MRRSITLTALALLGATMLVPAAGRAEIPCVDATDAVVPIAENPLDITGKFALPAEEPTHLVAFAHGYGHTSDSWVEQLRLAAEHGAVAFATDYRGTYTDADGDVRGWRVAEGAEEIVIGARTVMTACPSITTVIVYGVSMGGNTSGLAVAAKATRPGGGPLIDYWVAGEPAANVIETYLEARAVEAGVPFAAKARADIEEEHGGALWEQPASYAAGAVVLRMRDIATSGIKGVAVVHGFDDGLVPYNQGRELATLLRAAGVPTDFYNAARRETDGTPDGSDNTTLSENVARPVLGAAGQQYDEPLAGHGTESSLSNIVIRTGLQLVLALIDGDPGAIPGNHEYVVDGELGVQRIV